MAKKFLSRFNKKLKKLKYNNFQFEILKPKQSKQVNFCVLNFGPLGNNPNCWEQINSKI